jgi:hypothetical protein
VIFNRRRGPGGPLGLDGAGRERSRASHSCRRGRPATAVENAGPVRVDPTRVMPGLGSCEGCDDGGKGFRFAYDDMVDAKLVSDPLELVHDLVD